MLRLPHFLTLIISISLLQPSNASVAEPTSENSDRLRQAIERFPEADANGDGVLTLTEARAFMNKRRGDRSAQAKKPKELDLTTVDKSGNGLWVLATFPNSTRPV